MYQKYSIYYIYTKYTNKNLLKNKIFTIKIVLKTSKLEYCFYKKIKINLNFKNFYT